MEDALKETSSLFFLTIGIVFLSQPLNLGRRSVTGLADNAENSSGAASEAVLVGPSHTPGVSESAIRTPLF